MEGILNRLMDKWTGVIFYRLLQDWELNGFKLKRKDDYGDFIKLHSNRLAAILIVIHGGTIIDNLYRVSRDTFKKSQVFEDLLGQLVSDSRSDPVITASFSRDPEALKSFWLGVLLVDKIPDLEQILGDGLKEAFIGSKGIANYLTEEYFNIYHELINARPECRVLICPENGAITDFVDSRMFFSGDMLGPLEFLWDRGVNLGRKHRWRDVFENITTESGLPEGFHEAVIQLINTTTDYVVKTEFLKMLTVGAKGRLISVLKKATWHDRQDEVKRRAAQKRQPKEPDVVISDLESRYEESSSGDEALVRRSSSLKEDPDFAQTEYKSMLYEIADFNLLTDRERQVLIFKIAGAEEGKIPTNKKVGERMGISEVRVKQLFDGACQKLRGFYSSLDS